MSVSSFVINLKVNCKMNLDTDCNLTQNDARTTMLEFHVFDKEVEINYSELSSAFLVFSTENKTPLMCLAVVKTDHIECLVDNKMLLNTGFTKATLLLTGENYKRLSTQIFTLNINEDITVGAVYVRDKYR